ncbi:MAG: hypothetical protein ACI8PT_000297 [Gammaproteobacteria bacterium]|jgi:hypothetical protein
MSRSLKGPEPMEDLAGGRVFYAYSLFVKVGRSLSNPGRAT